MPRCFSAPTTSRRAGELCSLSLMSGQIILLQIFQTMSPAEAAPLRPTSSWSGTDAPGGLLIEANAPPEARMGQKKISLVLADVDGTLVTEEKILTERARSAVASLRSAGIRLAI